MKQRCDVCLTPLVFNQHADGVCGACHDAMLDQERFDANEVGPFCEMCDNPADGGIADGIWLCETCAVEAGVTFAHPGEYKHKPICHEYWDRGLNCPCIPEEENQRITQALNRGESIDDVIDAGWGPN
jgi:hypothetical protein